MKRLLAPLMAAQISVGFQATPVLTRADPVPGDSSLTEARITAPLAFASFSALGGKLELHAMLDFEGATMRDGQLSPGAWGEGFYDRRHPHALAHELMAWTRDPVALPLGLHWSVALGRGFAPFGSDDPMNRPALLYPTNHHWAQVLERGVAILGLSRGMVSLEAAAFNGDEPERFAEWPSWSRVGDSWSLRTLVHPVPELELQASYAYVLSPEDRAGAGPVNRKTSLSARYEKNLGPGTIYGLAEWTQNSESNGFFVFHSVIAEAQYAHGAHRHYARFEVADRPEDTRNFGDPFTSPRPPNDNSLIGVTRWHTLTAGSSFGLPDVLRQVKSELIVELGWAHVTADQGVFDPGAWYGRNDLLAASVALRISAGAALHRMGRYGVAAVPHDMGMAMSDMPGMRAQ